MNTPTPPTTKTTGITLRQRLDSERFKSEVARALPKHLTADRFVRIAATAIMRTPLLEKCDQTSVINSMMTLGQLGIELDGRRAHLIPYFNSKRNCYEAQLIIDYKGLAELAMRSGIVSTLHADMVCENDEFSYNKGQIERHVIDYKKPRGAAYCVYSVCRFKDGTEKAEVMGTEEVEAVRKRSKAANAGPWVTDWSEMAKKTVFRRLSKWLPLSPEFRDAIEADSEAIDVTPERVYLPVTFTPQANEPQVSDSEPVPDKSSCSPAEQDASTPAKRGPGRPRKSVQENAIDPSGPSPGAEPVEAEGNTDNPTAALPVNEPGEVRTPQQSLALQVTEAGFSWDDLVKWNADFRFVSEDLGSLGGFEDLQTKDAMHFLGSILGLLKQLRVNSMPKGTK